MIFLQNRSNTFKTSLLYTCIVPWICHMYGYMESRFTDSKIICHCKLRW